MSKSEASCVARQSLLTDFFDRLARFVAVLRSFGLKTGTSELNDAARALAVVDMLDREQFRLALRATLVKKHRDARIYDLVFDMFFVSGEKKDEQRRQEMEDVDERERLMNASEAEIAEGFSRSGGEWATGSNEHLSLTNEQLETYSLLPDGEKKRMSNLLENYRGNPVNDPSSLIAQVVGSSLDYWRYHLKKQEEEQGNSHSEIQVNYIEDAAVDEVVRSASRELANEPEESLLERDMRAIGDQDMPQVEVILRKMTRRLAAGLSRRYRSSRKKQSIDIRRSVRGSVRFGGIPIYLHYRRKRVQKPRLVLICDVSGSMAQYARLIIQVVYGISDVVRGVETFVFSEDLERVTSQLQKRLGFTDTMSTIMSDSKQWGKTTNLAAALRTFMADYGYLLTRNAFVIIVSDTKTLEPELAAGMLEETKRFVKDVLWLNTLPRSQWRDVWTVDVFGQIVRLLESNTLAQLERSLSIL